MCLRRSPARTLAFLKANRHNALKCTGPRTVRGKARASLNALKHGQYARKLGAILLAAGERGGAAFHAQVCRDIAFAFRVSTPQAGAQVERYANTVYTLARRAGVFGTKPECPLYSARLGPRSISYSRFAIHDWRQGVGLVYWVQRRRFWSLGRVFRALVFKEAEEEPPLRQSLESRLRRRVFRLRLPGLWQWQAFCRKTRAGKRWNRAPGG